MNRIAMTEPTARFTCLAACGLSMFAAGASIMLGLRHSQGAAALFLVLAVIGCIVTWLSYKRYTMLRNARWRTELAKSENELHQMLNHTRMNIIIEHVTGPLGGQPDMESESGEEEPVAKP
jgi:hypothetical protein